MNEESEDPIIKSDDPRANQNEVNQSTADRLSFSAFRYSRNEQEILESLEKIMNQGGKYPIKFKYSSNLVL
jgi:hypothetical protein